MGFPVTHFELVAKDPDATQAFYAQLFGWTITAMPEMSYHLIATGSPHGIQGGIGPVAEGRPVNVCFYVDVEDVADTLKQAEAMGCAVLMPATPVMPDLVLGMFKDPEGREVGLSHDTRASTLAAATAAEAKALATAKPKPAKKAKKKDKKKDKKKAKSGKKGKKKK